VKTGVQYDVVKRRFETLQERLKSDRDCLEWLGAGLRGAIVLDSQLLADTINRTGVASRFERAGNPASGISAVANLSPSWDIVVNAQGAFFYGGNIPGIDAAIAANSVNGQVCILLHELAHVVGAGIAHADDDASVNVTNKATIWSHCERTIKGS
jgi:hypothetical protein